jgi:hypothetical protein
MSNLLDHGFLLVAFLLVLGTTMWVFIAVNRVPDKRQPTEREGDQRES